MSTDYDVYCLDCEDEHGFYDANHCDKMMMDLARLGPEIAAFAPTFRKLQKVGNYTGAHLFLQHDRFPIDFDWFEKHGSHRLIARDEYGRNVDECGEYFTYCECKHQRSCRRPRGHDGLHDEKRDPVLP